MDTLQEHPVPRKIDLLDSIHLVPFLCCLLVPILLLGFAGYKSDAVARSNVPFANTVIRLDKLGRRVGESGGCLACKFVGLRADEVLEASGDTGDGARHLELLSFVGLVCRDGSRGEKGKVEWWWWIPRREMPRHGLGDLHPPPPPPPLRYYVLVVPCGTFTYMVI